MRIVWYTDREGYPCLPWPEGISPEVDLWYLEHLRKNKPSAAGHIWIKDIQVHSLLLAGGQAWDALNGLRDRRWEPWSDGDPFSDADPGSGTPHWRNTLEPEVKSAFDPKKFAEADIPLDSFDDKPSEIIGTPTPLGRTLKGPPPCVHCGSYDTREHLFVGGFRVCNICSKSYKDT